MDWVGIDLNWLELVDMGCNDWNGVEWVEMGFNGLEWILIAWNRLKWLGLLKMAWNGLEGL